MPNPGNRVARVKLTIAGRAIDGLEPATRPWIARDDRLTGFGVLVHPSGVKSYVVNDRLGPGGRGVPNKRLGQHEENERRGRDGQAEPPLPPPRPPRSCGSCSRCGGADCCPALSPPASSPPWPGRPPPPARLRCGGAGRAPCPASSARRRPRQAPLLRPTPARPAAWPAPPPWPGCRALPRRPASTPPSHGRAPLTGSCSGSDAPWSASIRAAVARTVSIISRMASS